MQARMRDRAVTSKALVNAAFSKVVKIASTEMMNEEFVGTDDLPSLRAKRSHPARTIVKQELDCFVASLLAMTG
jgi:hypothetical protein